jgi:hypothetical protein
VMLVINRERVRHDKLPRYTLRMCEVSGRRATTMKQDEASVALFEFARFTGTGGK